MIFHAYDSMKQRRLKGLKNILYYNFKHSPIYSFYEYSHICKKKMIN